MSLIAWRVPVFSACGPAASHRPPPRAPRRPRGGAVFPRLFNHHPAPATEITPGAG
nr:MAG TPA: hypothetical protein [Caudoviricetes sp.]